jgi:hypothetical protein
MAFAIISETMPEALRSRAVQFVVDDAAPMLHSAHG